MVTRAIPKVTAWSYSRYNSHSGTDGCPARFKWENLDKTYLAAHPMVKGPALLRGTAIHKDAEDWVKAAREPKLMPVPLQLFRKEFKALRKAKAVPEGRMAFDIMWRPLADYFDPRVWLRSVLDVHFSRKIGKTTKRKVVVDYKTGKIYPDNADQMELYGATSLSNWVDHDEVEVQLWYFDQGVLLPEKPLIYERGMLPMLQKKWERKIIPLMTDKRFAPRPGGYCSYCHFSKKKQGPCQY